MDGLAAVVRSHPQTARIIAGHLHTVLMRPWNGAITCTAPSTAPQFVLGRSRLGISFNADVHTFIVRLDGGIEQQIA